MRTRHLHTVRGDRKALRAASQRQVWRRPMAARQLARVSVASGGDGPPCRCADESSSLSHRPVSRRGRTALGGGLERGAVLTKSNDGVALCDELLGYRGVPVPLATQPHEHIFENRLGPSRQAPVGPAFGFNPTHIRCQCAKDGTGPCSQAQERRRQLELARGTRMRTTCGRPSSTSRSTASACSVSSIRISGVSACERSCRTSIRYGVRPKR